VIVSISAIVLQGVAANDLQFQQEQAAHTAYAACLFRENDARRRAGSAGLENFGTTCEAERAEIVRLDRNAGRSPDVIAAGLKGTDDTLREGIARMNRFYPANSPTTRN
jgi:hypothetical protein